MDNNLYRNSGNYMQLYSYRKAEAIYDITRFFCENFLRRGDRTIDQMVQAARSGKQNIIEGCQASAISSETEIKLVGVAKASLHELLADYNDYLRNLAYKDPVKGRIWEDGSVEVMAMRRLCRQNKDAAFFMAIVMTRPPETIANIAICLIKHVDYLLFKQLKTLEKQFLADGGFRERMTKMRLEQRKKNNNSDGNNNQ
ncbi:MAG: four helix bundle suffix domain-containing protein [Prevotellaceae bacterium]|jgi:four helix bundle suffix protein|nr:four helix bundle suffix domain-containing protein [Prevotellaceae bacterium]